MENVWFFLPVLLIFLVPFIFEIKEYENIEILDKKTNKNGLFVEYLFIIKVNGNKITLPVNGNIYNQIGKGSVVTLYYNTGDEKVTNYSV